MQQNKFWGVLVPGGTNFGGSILDRITSSLVPRPSPAPVFDRLQYAKTEPEAPFLHTASDQKPEPGKEANKIECHYVPRSRRAPPSILTL